MSYDPLLKVVATLLMLWVPLVSERVLEIVAGAVVLAGLPLNWMLPPRLTTPVLPVTLAAVVVDPSPSVRSVIVWLNVPRLKLPERTLRDPVPAALLAPSASVPE